MADVLTFAAKKKHKSDNLLRKILWGIIIILVIFSIIQLFFHFFIAPRVTIKNILIKSDIPFTEQEILRIAGISRKEYYFLINTREIQDRLMAHPLVRTAFVQKIFPDTISLKLEGRVPLMIALVNRNNTSIPVTIDEEGVVFQIADMVKNWNLPVLSGIRFDSLDLGIKLPHEIVPFLQGFKKLNEQHPGLASLISEIKIVKNESGDFEYIVYPLSFPKGVWVGRKIDASIIKYILLALRILEQEGILHKVSDLDFRTGELVYKMKEE
ncbi:MAG: FtsQ-type POTRA domain-containing protein [Spirochaetales bacterium]|nr:FtsQ-type POTRA domain-containing protein [Spirochaetales bacterium]